MRALRVGAGREERRRCARLRRRTVGAAMQTSDAANACPLSAAARRRCRHALKDRGSRECVPGNVLGVPEFSRGGPRSAKSNQVIPGERGRTMPFSNKPLYLQVRDVLADLISSGTWKPGFQIPNEVELARDVGV